MGRLTSFLGAAVIAACLGASAGASPSSVGFADLKGDAAGPGQGLVQKVHGCHRDIELGAGGWHRHVGPYCTRVSAHRPRPRCWRDCDYVGPIKVCKTKCR